MSDLTDIDGIGPSYAEELQNAGYESVADVANADPDELDDLISTHDGETLVENAQPHVDDEPTDDVEPELTGDEYHELPFDIDEDQRNHLIKGLVNEEMRERRRNQNKDVDVIKESIQAVIDGEPYEMTKQQIDTAYRAVNQLESEYRSQRGVGAFVTKLRNLSNDLQDLRSDLHPE